MQSRGLLDGSPSAILGFSTDIKMYKSNDFRCLKPKDGVPIEKWPHYEMHGYRAAKSEEELEEVEEIPFDKYFFNFEDPEILNAMTDGTEKGLNLWKRTYGWDWAAWIPSSFTFSSSATDLPKGREHCLQAEYDDFAQNCKNNGGFFKCCLKSIAVDIYHLIRYALKTGYKLIKEGPNKPYCGEYIGQGFCYLGLATHSCTYKVCYIVSFRYLMF